MTIPGYSCLCCLLLMTCDSHILLSQYLGLYGLFHIGNQCFLNGLIFPLFMVGVSQLKDKWNKYKQPRKLKKLTSLFISPRGERVAVAAGNQITVLQKEDDYLEPCGTFSSKIHQLILLLYIHNVTYVYCQYINNRESN